MKPVARGDLFYWSDVSRDLSQSGEAVRKPVGHCNLACELGESTYVWEEW